jgi:thiamine biosynthesis lipoprotein
MNVIRRSKPLLGTFVEITVRGDCDEDTLLAQSELAFRSIAEIDQRMSFHRRDSELSYLNLYASRERCEVSPAMAEVLRQALALSILTQGIFDVANGCALVTSSMLPDHGFSMGEGNWQHIELDGNQVYFKKPLLIDLGGIAKGFAVDQALASVDEKLDVAINAGGDICMRPWQQQDIMIRSPGEQGKGLVQRMLRPALATSACYFHGDDSAIVERETRKPLHRPHSYSVFAPNCMLADALTKVLFLERNPEALFRQLDAVGLILQEDGTTIKVADA